MTHLTFRAVILVLGLFLFLNPASAESRENPNTLDPESIPTKITDDDIENFLFRISEEVINKVKTISANPITNLPVPILFGAAFYNFEDTWGEARSGDRVHTGTDIIAPLGELVVSPTDAVVTKIGYDILGGNFVVTANPGGEQFYFAHLDRAAENLSVGDILKPGDLIGYVGNTGNARGKLPHLHLGIYYKKLAQNPFPRLMREFSPDERMAALGKIFASSKIILGANNGGVRALQIFLIERGAGPQSEALARAGATGYYGSLTRNALMEYQKTTNIIPASGYFNPATKANILSALNPQDGSLVQTASSSEIIIPEADISYLLAGEINEDLSVGSSGEDVLWLQSFLVNAGTGPYADALANIGATGYFGNLTKDALAEYQLAVGISPASGYFGPITRASIKTLGGN